MGTPFWRKRILRILNQLTSYVALWLWPLPPPYKGFKPKGWFRSCLIWLVITNKTSLNNMLLHRGVVNQPIHSFLVWCLNPCLQGTSVQVVLPQPGFCKHHVFFLQVHSYKMSYIVSDPLVKHIVSQHASCNRLSYLHFINNWSIKHLFHPPPLISL